MRIQSFTLKTYWEGLPPYADPIQLPMLFSSSSPSIPVLSIQDSINRIAMHCSEIPFACNGRGGSVSTSGKQLGRSMVKSTRSYMRLLHCSVWNIVQLRRNFPASFRFLLKMNSRDPVRDMSHYRDDTYQNQFLYKVECLRHGKTLTRYAPGTKAAPKKCAARSAREI